MAGRYAARQRTHEEGAVAVTSAIILTVLVLMAALTIDLGFLRADRVESKAVADMAAAAAVVDYVTEADDAARIACEEAIAFAEANLGAQAVAVAGQGCEEVYDADYVCDDDVAPDPPAAYLVGEHQIEVFIPVPDDHPLMQDLTHGEAHDGRGCERVGVRLQRDRNHLLARVAGFAEATTTQGSVGVVRFDGDEEEFASLVVLERDGCQVLRATGGGEIRVFTLVRWEDADGNPILDEEGDPYPIEGEPGVPGAKKATYEGTITTDTLPDGCSGGQKIIEADGGSLLFAEGDIFAHSLVREDPGNAVTYDPADVDAGRIDPPPRAGPRIERRIVDHQFNCLTESMGGYPWDGEEQEPVWSPDAAEQGIAACPEGTDENPAPPPYLRNLDDAIDDVMGDFENDDLPGEWRVFPDNHDADDCSGTDETVIGGHWIVDCPTAFGPDGLEFRNVEHIIFTGGLDVGTGDELKIHGDDTTGTVVTLYNGRLARDGGVLELKNVFTYIRNLEPASVAERVNINVSGSAGTFALQAPLDESGCDGYAAGLPPAACFSPLAVWSNYATAGFANRYNRLAGNATGGVIGTVFTPNARFRFEADGDFQEQLCGSVSWGNIIDTEASMQLEGSQFFVESIRVAGGAEVGMCPSPDTTLGVPLRSSGLIR